MNYQEFEKKVKSMSAHDIIMAMVNGLRNLRTKIDMGTYGEIIEGVCYGCAATNTVLHIMDINKEEEIMGHIRVRKHASMVYKTSLLWQFERAIDFLRQGRLEDYNQYASMIGIAQITPMPGLVLPHLGNNYTNERLQQYEKLAKHQLTV